MQAKRAIFVLSLGTAFAMLGIGTASSQPAVSSSDLSKQKAAKNSVTQQVQPPTLEPVEAPDGRLIPQVERGDGFGGGRVYPKCLLCHSAIENATEVMGFDLDCTFCHGGDPDAEVKDLAHVMPTLPVIMDKTVAPLDYDLPYQRFVNPTNLRVVGETCGLCHPERFETVHKSMMATAAGHYAGGLYQNAVQDTKTPIYGTFAVDDLDGYVPVERGAVQHLDDLIEYDPLGDPQDIATHFAAVPAQACARCHLWSRGKGYRGALNADGVYRADGCAACHMLYANDGLSQSADMTIDHAETGHPIIHKITKQIDTEQCIHCHHRGARIGLNFTGRAQMPPRLPSGPGVAGTTDVRFNGNYHYTESGTNPPDAHRTKGLECIDCHTARGIMGDGNIYGHMDQATKIECRMCHGLPGQAPTFVDHDGLELRNTQYDGTQATLTGKVDGQVHTIPLVKDIVDPLSDRYNPRAACAMNNNHLKAAGGLECYSCHSAWTPNCFGCHFERDERFMGVNLVTRNEEVGRVRTGNKVFETLRPFFIGPNSEGRVAPYLVACQPIADVTAPDGSKILDFKMPRTTKGLSGLALNPVQPHTVQGPGNVRTCAECHRTPVTLGMGTGNYSLARNYAFLAAPGGVRVYDRKTDPTMPAFVATLDVANPMGIVSRPDVVEGTADAIYVAAGTDGLIGFNLQNGPNASPQPLISGINAIGVARVARYFYIIDQGVGVHVYDSMEGPRPVSDRPSPLLINGIRTPRYITTIATPNAQRVLVWGIHLFIAAGEDGLVIVNIADQENPVIVASIPSINAQDVTVYSHYQQGQAFEVRAYVADPTAGVHVINLLPNLNEPVLVQTIPMLGASGLDTYAAWVTGDGTTPSFEHDYLYVAAGSSGLNIMDITVPDSIYQVAALQNLGGSVVDVDVASQMSPPGVEDYAMLANSGSGLQVIDVTDPTNPQLVDSLPASGAGEVFVEVQQLDRFLNEQGWPLKETSHPFIKSFVRADIVRILSTDIVCGNGSRGSPDINSDGVIDVLDVMLLIRALGTRDATADLNGDGIVNEVDFQIILNAL